MESGNYGVNFVDSRNFACTFFGKWNLGGKL